MKLLILLYLFNFIRTLLIILIIYYAIRLIVRYVLPILVDKSLKNMQQKMNDQQQQFRQRPNRPDGKVTVERNRSNQRNPGEDDGEYVDFEEVD